VPVFVNSTKRQEQIKRGVCMWEIALGQESEDPLPYTKSPPPLTYMKLWENNLTPSGLCFLICKIRRWSLQNLTQFKFSMIS
jgi:hypothetical protein